jgi:hypothetical protein
MFPIQHDLSNLSDRRIRPDRRDVPTSESEIRLRIKRAWKAA